MNDIEIFISWGKNKDHAELDILLCLYYSYTTGIESSLQTLIYSHKIYFQGA